jgi:hypothetical protein
MPLVVLVLVCVPTPTWGKDADSPSDIETRAKAIVNALAREDFKSVTQDFNAAMRKALPPDGLEEGWKELTSEVGTFQKEIGIRREHRSQAEVVVITCRFEKGDVDVRVAFDAARQVSGLYLVPSNEVPWFAATPTLIGVGVVLMASAVPLMLRRVPPNRWYGIRFPATIGDQEVWYEVNARSGRDLFCFGAVYLGVLLALPALVPGLGFVARILLPVGILCAGAPIVLIRAKLHADRLLADRRRAGDAGLPAD